MHSTGPRQLNAKTPSGGDPGDLMLVRPDEGGLQRGSLRVTPPGRHHDVRKTRKRDGDEQLEIFSVRPAERASRPVRPAELKPSARHIWPVPQLLREREPLPGEPFQRANQLGCGQPHRERMTRSLAGQDRRRPPPSAAVPKRAILVLSVLV